MVILWIVNIVFPEAEALLHGQGCLRASGGWLLGASDELAKQEGVQLHVASVAENIKELKTLKGEKIIYHLIPKGSGNEKYNISYEKYWKVIKSEVHPDIVHIHGTEFSHGLAYLRACGNENVVVSIQGLVSVYARYYRAGLSWWKILTNITLRDFIRGSIFRGEKNFKNRGEREREMIRRVRFVIGRTSWDYDHVKAINSSVRYFFCNETLRKELYGGERWIYDKCIRHSIFLSQSTYPIKGTHKLLEALPLILRRYPDTIVRIGGQNMISLKNWKDLTHYSGYGKILKGMISKLKLTQSVFFLGPLSASGMKDEYLRANVFVCPSSIENSPNSLGEAQILGVPCVASYVGGEMDMMKGDEGNLYRFEEVEMLAEKICSVFAAEDKQIDMREVAQMRHDVNANVGRQVEIYKEIQRC